MTRRLTHAGAQTLGFTAVEAGWIVTEVGRQPWTIYGVLKTADAVTPMPGLAWHFAGFSVLYIGLSAATVVLMIRQFRAAPTLAEVPPVSH